MIAQLRTTDLKESIRFYTQEIGLMLDFEYEDFYAGIRAGNQVFHLKLVGEKDPLIKFVDDGEHFHLYFGTDDVEGTAEAFTYVVLRWEPVGCGCHRAGAVASLIVDIDAARSQRLTWSI